MGKTIQRLSSKGSSTQVLEKHTYCLTKFHHEGKFLKINETRKHIPLDKYYIDPVNWVQLISVSNSSDGLLPSHSCKDVLKNCDQHAKSGAKFYISISRNDVMEILHKSA